MRPVSNTAARSAVLAASLLAASCLAGLALASALEARGIGGAEVVRAAYAPLCHQLPARSLHFAGQPLPVCARCLGLYAGGFGGLFLAWLIPALGKRANGRWLVIALLPTIVDGLARVLGWPGAANLPRLVLALPAGMVAGLLLAEGVADLAAHGPAGAWRLLGSHRPGSVPGRG